MTIANMGGAIEHWLGFQDKIGRSFMINEHALKYPLADYLVNDGKIPIKSIDLEKQHPNFSNRLVDVSVFNDTNGTLDNVFELKLAKSITRNQSEKQRIFNDLMRLYLANIVTGGKCYFIITGKSINFQQDFQNYPNTGTSFYKKWFAFVNGQKATFDVATETNTDYQTIYQNFINIQTVIKQLEQVYCSCQNRLLQLANLSQDLRQHLCHIWQLSGQYRKKSLVVTS